jgi:Uri superfamily endonuclease
MKNTNIICSCGAILKRNIKSHYFSKKHIDYLLKENISDDAYNIIEYIEII